jgi:hypothetical protein
MITIPFRVNQLTLAGLEAWIRLADNVGTATAADDLAIRMTVLQ